MPYYWNDPDDPLMKEAVRIGHDPVKVTMEVMEWVGIVGMLQLALRHPGVEGSEPANAARRFIDQAKANLGPLSPIIVELIERGDNPDYDLPL